MFNTYNIFKFKLFNKIKFLDDLIKFYFKIISFKGCK